LGHLFLGSRNGAGAPLRFPIQWNPDTDPPVSNYAAPFYIMELWIFNLKFDGTPGAPATVSECALWLIRT
jgi:hypothetical protein